MLPAFDSAHTFCASPNVPRKSGFLKATAVKTEIFARFRTTRVKQILARVAGIRKENWGNLAFFRDTLQASIWRKMLYIVLYLSVLL